MKRVMVACLILLALPLRAVGQEPSCDGNFRIVHELGDAGRLYDVDFSAPGDGWAVGYDYENDENMVSALGHGPQERPWVVRFGPDSFESITPPHELGTELASVEAIASDDVYAAGYRFLPRRRAETVVYHWDGAAWTRMSTPSPGVRAHLRGIVAVAPTDIWAVGEFTRRGQYGSQTLVLHFDGSRWERVPSPSPARFSDLHAIDAVSARQVWAVGGKRSERPLMLRWNGVAWRTVEVPRRIRGALFGTDVVAADDVWAAGPHLVRFAGGRWRQPATPDLRGSETYVDVAVASEGAWAVGYRFVLYPYETVIPLAAYRDDEGQWQRAAFEGDRFGAIEAVALDGTGAAWAVGETFDADGPDVGDVIERACAP